MLRGLADVGGTVFFLSALVRMPMGDVFGILQFTPLAITAAAALFLGARVGWRRWTATCAGLVGVLIIVRPGGEAFTPYALLAVVSVLFSVARDLLTRGVGTGVPTLVIAALLQHRHAVSPAHAFETWMAFARAVLFWRPQRRPAPAIS